jgi:hypothetical protein
MNRLGLQTNHLSGTVPTGFGTRFLPSSLTWSTNCLVNVTYRRVGCELPERQALVELFALTNGTGWTINTGWASSVHPCTWYNVKCATTTGPVTSLVLTNNGLVGLLPESMSLLAALQVLALDSNALSGTIPSGISLITALS